MAYGMKPNAYKNTINLIMSNKSIVYGLLCFGFSLFGFSASADEVLGHISDETEPTIQQPSAAENANSDRKIIYRVICSPADEQLPDCEKPFHDVEADNKPQPIHDDSDQAHVDEQQADSANEEKPAPQQPAKPALKAANKKQDKLSKKPVGKKDKPTVKAGATQKTGKKDTQKPAVKKPVAKKK